MNLIEMLPSWDNPSKFMKRHTTRPRRHSRQSVLEVRVFTPRACWFGFKKVARRLLQLACVLALIGGGVWVFRYGSQKWIYQNPDFRLRVISLNPNPVIDELGVAAAAGIDLAANPNLFDIDVKEVVRKLCQQPAIATASVERHLPDTLAVNVSPRLPKAWISSSGADPATTRREGGMLVDADGVAYPCPPLLLKSCGTLPILVVPASGAQPFKMGGKIALPEVEPCFLLLEAAQAADPDALQWIESVRQVNDWSLLLITRQGTAATFGLGDHARQMASLRAALDHASEKGYVIATINLIPKYNIPITLREDPAPPLRAIPVSAKDAAAPPPRAIPVSTKMATPGETRRSRDQERILKRN